MAGRRSVGRGSRRRGEEWPDEAVRASWRTLSVSGPFDGDQLLAFLAARAIPGVERVEHGVFRRALALAHGPAVVELDLGRPDRVRFRLAAGDSRDRRDAIARCRRLLGIDADPAQARAALADDPLLGPLVASRPGLRVPGTLDGSELLVRAIVNQQVSLGAGRTVLGRIASDFGQALPHSEERLVPPPERLAEIDPATLPMPRARGRAVVAACAAIASGRLDLQVGADPKTTRAALLALPGIGDWTASYVAMRALRDPDAFLATDLGIRRALARLGRRTDRRSVEELAARWRPWRAYAAQHLWASVA
ncbi:MAG: AraC family transcriptional regulator [Thermoleophilaceae bacterium]|nr:AraC family transcriptional regulator [Thermoleophilaceae bacterium]